MFINLNSHIIKLVMCTCMCMCVCVPLPRSKTSLYFCFFTLYSPNFSSPHRLFSHSTLLFAPPFPFFINLFSCYLNCYYSRSTSRTSPSSLERYLYELFMTLRQERPGYSAGSQVSHLYVIFYWAAHLATRAVPGYYSLQKIVYDQAAATDKKWHEKLPSKVWKSVCMKPLKLYISPHLLHWLGEIRITVQTKNSLSIWISFNHVVYSVSLSLSLSLSLELCLVRACPATYLWKNLHLLGHLPVCKWAPSLAYVDLSVTLWYNGKSYYDVLSSYLVEDCECRLFATDGMFTLFCNCLCQS